MSADAGNLPSGIVTFLFTDVEGSTRRWEADPHGMRAAIAAHDQVLRQAIQSHGGRLFKHTGDGVCAAFASPRSAVDAAVAAQLALELPVRMGLATGEAESRDGDYFGTALNRAARVMAAGHGGQILLTDSTAVMVSGVELMDLGPHRLRDLPTAVGVFQVRAPGLRTEFPALRALDTGPGNLRPPLTSFVGRESQVDNLQATLKVHRLVTLTGVGGVGKTRLALEVAARLIDEFPDGAWLFELAAVTDPAAVPDAVAAALGVTQQVGKTVTESVATALEGRVRLLIFDNCEHVRDAAADLIEAILTGSATARILATSRERLEVPDEQLWSVPSLDVVGGINSAAANLFVDRAQRVSSGFSVTEAGDATAIAEICRRLDGIPLAIELAASRMASMTPIEVRDRLDHRFRLLVGSRRGLGRHQTLRHAVAWSYDHLDAAEKQLLDRCSVHAGGFDLQSACAAAGLDHGDDFEVLDLLDALVRKSLLVVNRISGRTRYSMLETIREFAEEQLVARGEATTVRAAHAHHFARKITQVMADWDNPNQREAYAWLNAELANLRTAFRWASDHDDLDTATTIATDASFLGYMVDKFEPVAWSEELLERARAANHPHLTFLYVMASQCCMAGRITDAVRYADIAVRMLDSYDQLPYGVEGWPCSAYTTSGQPERSIEFCRAQLRRGRDTHNFTRVCLILPLAFGVPTDEAVALTDGLVERAEATNNPAALCLALLADGFVFRDVDPARSLTALHQGLMLAQNSGNHFIESQLAAVLCRVEAEHGNPLAALDYFRLAINNHYESGNTTLISTPLAVLTAFFDQLGRREAAATIAGFAFGPVTMSSFPELSSTITHLRDVLGNAAYETLAQAGAQMTTAAMANYAFDQIDQTRMELEQAR
ncbi:ATP-binding protein [Mycobacterium conspicuum]|uniref:ATP-binding protein n=1 Tax=Mycobacterium conspicuum TaxID=44010 RepID=UPI000A238EFC|nr:adenylate/guanylate cyclase domain-containing protein [Mycobacterium conspicuum]ORV46774.1 cyclase [Mycobacterium conspicuum]